MDHRILYETDQVADQALIATLFKQITEHTQDNEFHAVTLTSSLLGLMVLQVAKNSGLEDAMTVSNVVLEQLEKAIRRAQRLNLTPAGSGEPSSAEVC